MSSLFSSGKSRKSDYSTELSYKDKYSRDDFYDDDLYARDGGGYGHHGGGYQMSYKKSDIFSLLALAAFALAIGYLIWYCLLNNANMCAGMRRKKRSLHETLEERVTKEMELIFNFLNAAENLWMDLP